MRVVFLPSDIDGTGHYRHLHPARELARAGVAVQVAPHVVARGDTGPRVMYGEWESQNGEARMRRSVFDWLEDTPYDVLVMGMRSELEWVRQIKRLQALGKKVLVDSDDCWLGLPAWNPGSGKPNGEKNAMLAQLKACDGLSVATPALADVYRRWQPNTRVIRNRLDWRMWADTTPVYAGRGWQRLRVGWMGSARWHAGDLQTLRPIIRPWLEQHPEVDFVACGDPRTHDILGVPDGQRVSTNRTNFWEGDLADITAVMDIGLVPLDLSDAKSRRLNECKSHLKGLEYNACGVPFIASPSESYQWWHQVSRGGLLAETPRGWHAALDALLDEPFRHLLAQNGRAAAERHSIQNGGADEWADWLNSNLDSDDPRQGAAARRVQAVH